MSTLDGLGARLSELVRSTGLSQQDFAERLETSPSFISDIVRGVKRPGSEFLHKVREAFGVSIDWLLDGSGAMRGGRPIEIDSFKLIAAQIELARLAKIDGEPKALTLLGQLCGAEEARSLSAERMGELLKPYVKASEEILLAALIYNSHLWTTNAEERIRGGISTASAFFESKRPLDILKALLGAAGAEAGVAEAATTGVHQVNIGSRVRAAAGDYYEGRKRPKRD